MEGIEPASKHLRPHRKQHEPNALPEFVAVLTDFRDANLQHQGKLRSKQAQHTHPGIPVVPAFGITIHGVQDGTKDEAVITDLRAPRHVDRHALYVALSRVRTRAGVFWVGKKPCDCDFTFFSPDQDVLDEDRRLTNLAAATERT